MTTWKESDEAVCVCVCVCLCVCVCVYVCVRGRGEARPGEESGEEAGKAGSGQVMKHFIWQIKVSKPDSEIIRGSFCRCK